MLARLQGKERQRIPFVEIGQQILRRRIAIFIFPVAVLSRRPLVPTLDVDFHKTVEAKLLARGSKNRFPDGNLEGGLIV